MSNEMINILLAEDDPNLGTILRAYLKQKGCNVFLAVDGEKAIEFFRNEDAIDICAPRRTGGHPRRRRSPRRPLRQSLRLAESHLRRACAQRP